MSERQQIGAAIRRIAWGYIFIHVHFNLITMDILADWLGYCMIFWALPVLAKLPIDPAIAQSYDSGLMETVNTDAVSDVIAAIQKAE